MISISLNIEQIIFNALVMWALLSLLFDQYQVVTKIIPNPSWRTRLLCPKCLSFWLTLLFTLNVFTALAVAFLINLYSKYIKFTEL